MDPTRAGHDLAIATYDASTLGTCSCGAWHREADHETVTLTGRPREDVLRAAHADHVREAFTAAATPRVRI